MSVGARIVCGGKTDGVMMEATLLENVPHCQSLYAEEAFGPVALLSRFTDFDQALAEANEMPYGGVKKSGQGREGVRFAMEEMTESRLLVLRTP